MSQKYKERYEQNKETLKLEARERYHRNNEKINCICGSCIVKNCLKKHLTTKKHINFINNNNNNI